jgi:hypothetical protein
MSRDATLKRLRERICDLGLQDGEVELVLDDAGIDGSRIARGSTAEITWHNLLNSLHSRGELVPLLDVLCERYSNRADLRDAVVEYRANNQRVPGELLAAGEPYPVAQPTRATDHELIDSANSFPSLASQALGIGETATAAFSAAPTYLDPPALPEWVSRRTETVRRLVSELDETIWAIFQGGARTGKTILATLLADQLGGIAFFIRLRGVGTELAALELDRAFAAISRMSPGLNRNLWYEQVCGVVGRGRVIVIDDLPEVEANDPLWIRVESFARVCIEQGVRLFCTTLKPVADSLVHEFGGRRLRVIKMPPLTEIETAEVFRAHGAPDEIASEEIGLMHLFCREHPFLVVAACVYLRKRGWRLDKDGLNAIVGATHTDSVAQEVLRRLLATVPDGDARKLLYRLSLVGGRFAVDLVDALAEVNPEIDRARERLHELTGAWVERHVDGRYEVSALLAQIGREQLSELRRKNCHRKIGRALFRGRMNQYRTLQVITHFIQGEEYDLAGTALLLMLIAANREPELLPEDPIFRLWSDWPLPAPMNLNIKLCVRGVQLAVFTKLGRPCDYPLSDLVRLQREAQPRHRYGLSVALSFGAFAIAPETILGLCRVAKTFLSLPPAPRKNNLRRKRRHIPDLTLEDPDLLLEDRYTFERVVRLLGLGIQTSEHLLAWVELVCLLPREQQRRLFWPEEKIPSLPAPGDFLITSELKKRAENRNWDAVVCSLEAVSARVRGLGSEELWASLIRTQIRVLDAYLARIDQAKRLADDALKQSSNDPLVIFLIAVGIGERLVLAGEEQGARPYLQQALDDETIPPFHDKMIALLAASRAFGSTDPEAGVSWAEKAVAVAGNLREAVPLEEVKALAELGVAQFQHGGIGKAFWTWDKAAGLILALHDTGDAWKDLFVLFGHATGYLTRLATSGQPPSSTSDGQVYAAPARGMFLSENRARLDYFRAANVSGLPYFMSVYAGGVGEYGRAAYWRSRSAQARPEGILPVLLPGILREEVPSMLRGGKLAEVVEAARRAGAIVVVGNDSTGTNENLIDALGADQDHAALSRHAQLRAESVAMLLGVVPAVIHIATLDTDDETTADAKSSACELVAICRSIPSTSARPAYWEEIAWAIEMAFVDRRRYPDILLWKKTLGQLLPEQELVVFLAMAANATAEEAITVLAPILMELERLYPPRTEVHRTLLLPYVERYWSSSFKRMRFRFRSPDQVSEYLEGAYKESEEMRIRAIIKAVSSGFRVAPSEKLDSWLNRTD